MSAPTQTHSRETLTGEELAIRKTHTHTHTWKGNAHTITHSRGKKKRGHTKKGRCYRDVNIYTRTHTLTGMCDLQEQPWRGQPGKGGRRSTPSSSKSVETNRDDELTKTHTDT